ncbi:hypothetical protein [Nocardioides sp.]|uniref:hypothetical protein n=1 Tax=Nocardioides sp. TaxID=35761 RepID=UPI003512BE07
MTTLSTTVLPPLRRTSRRRRLATLALLATATGGALTACSSDDGGDAPAGGDASRAGSVALVGTFALDPGACDGAPSGSYFRMVNSGGTLEEGPYFPNPDSSCSDPSITPIAPGTDGGLVTGGYQPSPDPAFDDQGNAQADGITAPAGFAAIQFGLSTQETDPQTGTEVPAPEILAADGELSGQITAWSASWNSLYFNQGSPKPDGSSPGLTAPVSGTYDEETGRFVLEWASAVVDGPFNGFTGVWHLEGTFTPA